MQTEYANWKNHFMISNNHQKYGLIDLWKWYEALVVISNNHQNHMLFFRHSKDEKKAILIVYVDDTIPTWDNLEEIERLKRNLATEFEIKDLGQIQYFFRMEVARSKKAIIVSQHKYVLNFFIRTGMLGCKPRDTSIEMGNKLKGLGELIDKERYLRLVRKLIYLILDLTSNLQLV